MCQYSYSINKKPYFRFPLLFPDMLLSQIRSRIPCYLSLSCLLRHFSAMTASQNFVVLMTLTWQFWVLFRHFVERPSPGVHLMFFSLFDWCLNMHISSSRIDSCEIWFTSWKWIEFKSDSLIKHPYQPSHGPACLRDAAVLNIVHCPSPFVFFYVCVRAYLHNQENRWYFMCIHVKILHEWYQIHIIL